MIIFCSSQMFYLERKIALKTQETPVREETK